MTEPVRISRSRRSADYNVSREPAKGSIRRAARQPLVLVALAAAIPIILFGGGMTYLVAQEERSGARRDAFAAVEMVAERVAFELRQQLEVAEALSASTSLDDPDLTSFYLEARRLKSARPLWETVELLDPSGMQLLNLLRPLGSQLGPTADRESFERVLLTKKPVIGDIGPVGQVSGKRLIALRGPALRAGDLRYVVTIQLAPDALSAILRSAGAPRGWIGAIVDAKGNFVARTLAERFELGRPASAAVRAAIAAAADGSYVGQTLEGVNVETVYRSLRDTGGWSVHIGVPQEVLNAPVRRSLLVMAGGSLASLALAGMLALFTARDIAQRRSDDQLRSSIALGLSEDRGTLAVEAADLGTWAWDVAGERFIGSERFRQILGLPPEEGRARGGEWPLNVVLAAVHPDDRDKLEDALQHSLRSGMLAEVEFRSVWNDGSVHWVRATGRVPRVKADAESLHGVVVDIGAQKRSEAERTALHRKLSEIQENERRRIARELHDQVGQSLTGLSLGLKRLETAVQLGDSGGQASAQVRWLQEVTAQIGRDIHRAASDLRPTALDDLGLQNALQAYLSDWSERFGIAADVQTLGREKSLPAQVQTTVYRIIQEALTNVFKHARARNVSVLLDYRPSELRLIIEDDGVGFSSEQVAREFEEGPTRARLGLLGIRERLGLLGGAMTLESEAGAGTSLFIQIPTRQSEGD